MAQITETGTIDLKAQKAARDDAARTATNYITTVDNDGIMVADAGSGASGGSITSGTTGWHLGGVLEFIRQGVSRFWIGLKNANDTTPTVRIGKAYDPDATDNESHMELDYHSLQMVDKEGDTYFHVSDLRNASGYAEITETLYGNASQVDFTVQYEPRSKSTSEVLVDGSSVEFEVSGHTFTLATAPPMLATVTINYETSDSTTKAFTFGNRQQAHVVGAGSSTMGMSNRASGICSTAFGYSCNATGSNSHAEGFGAIASGFASHAEGQATIAADSWSHAEGYGCECYGYSSHAEGYSTTASGDSSHAEGNDTTASGVYSHAEGNKTTASNYYTHAEGGNTTASGRYSHAQNHYTIAASDNQTALGKYNVEDANDTYAVIVGNGTSDTARSNALAVKWNGDVEIDDGRIEISDSGWKALPLNGNAFKVFNGDASYTPMYRKVNGIVEVTGGVSPLTAQTLGETGVTIGTLPEKFRPGANRTVQVICQGSGRKLWLLRINSSGVVSAQRMRDMGSTSYQSMSTTEWMIFTATFLAG